MDASRLGAAELAARSLEVLADRLAGKTTPDVRRFLEPTDNVLADIAAIVERTKSEARWNRIIAVQAACYGQTPEQHAAAQDTMTEAQEFAEQSPHLMPPQF